jgi:hypothetical protein
MRTKVDKIEKQFKKKYSNKNNEDQILYKNKIKSYFIG